jgi:hypothetical protein
MLWDSVKKEKLRSINKGCTPKSKLSAYPTTLVPASWLVQSQNYWSKRATSMPWARHDKAISSAALRDRQWILSSPGTSNPGLSSPTTSRWSTSGECGNDIDDGSTVDAWPSTTKHILSSRFESGSLEILASPVNRMTAHLSDCWQINRGQTTFPPWHTLDS